MNAISLDGFICTNDGNSDWVVDDDIFEIEVAQHDCIVVGRATYEQYEGEIYPVPGAANVVLTGDPSDFEEEQTDTLLFLSGQPQSSLQQIREKNMKTVLLVGGSDTNARFAAAGLIDNVILDVHPILLGGGKRLLGGYVEQIELEKLQTTQHDGFTQIRAKVKKAA